MNEEDYINMHWTDAFSEFLQHLTSLARKIGKILDQEIEASKPKQL